ncbi:unnamed protein product [Caenorhabditis brenneri]
MSDFPSLYELSLDAVAECFRNRIPPTHHVEIIPKVQKDIFETVMNLHEYCYNAHTKALIEMLQPTKLKLRFNGIREGTFAEIRKLKLTELRILNYELISKYSVPKTEQGASTDPSKCDFRISRFLHDILSPETKQGLRVLHIPWSKEDLVLLRLNWDGSFEGNWMEEVSSMFPNLEELNIEGRNMCATGFTNLCNNLPHLRSPDISYNNIKNLNGISKLQNLDCLNIRGLSFETKKDIKELFELKQLKQLEFGDNARNWNYEWFFEKPHAELATLGIRWEYAHNGFLRKIRQKLPKLQTVITYDTEITQAAAHPKFSLYTVETIEAFLAASKYFRSQSNLEEVGEVFEYFGIYGSRRDIEDEFTPELMALMINELEAVIRDFKLSRRVLPGSVEHFLTHLPEFINGIDNQPNVDKLRIMNILLMDLENHLEKRTSPKFGGFDILCIGINALIKTTENFNVDKVCSLTMKTIIYAGGALEWEEICVEILDSLIDRMEFSSEYYKIINFLKLHGSLENIQKRTDLLPEQKAGVGNVLRFVELFM